TRWPRDWSSDVCSSDLSHPNRNRVLCRAGCRLCCVVLRRLARATPGLLFTYKYTLPAVNATVNATRTNESRLCSGVAGWGGVGRSEERRVGEGCGAGWW